MASSRRPDPQLLAQFRQRILASLAQPSDLERAQTSPQQVQMLDVLAKIVDEARQAGVAQGSDRIWLFGSFAWGQPDEHSDVDLLIDSPNIDELAWRISRSCGRLVHAIALTEASPSLRRRVLRQGRPL